MKEGFTSKSFNPEQKPKRIGESIYDTNTILTQIQQHPNFRGLLQYGSSILHTAVSTKSDIDLLITCHPEIIPPEFRLETILKPLENHGGIINVFNDIDQGFGSSDDLILPSSQELCLNYYSKDGLREKISTIFEGNFGESEIFKPLGMLDALSSSEWIVGGNDNELQSIIKQAKEYPDNFQMKIIDVSMGKYQYHMNRINNKYEVCDSGDDSFDNYNTFLVEYINKAINNLLHILFAKNKKFFTGTKRLKNKLLEFMKENEANIILDTINKLTFNPPNSIHSLKNTINDLDFLKKIIIKPKIIKKHITNLRTNSDPLQKILGVQLTNNFLGLQDPNMNIINDTANTLLATIKDKMSPKNSRIGNPRDFTYNEEIKQMEGMPTIGEDINKVIVDVSKFLDGMMQWHNPNCAFNVTPTPFLPAVGIKTVLNVLNPNTLWDNTSGEILLAEKNVVKMLSEVIGWDNSLSGGISTIGGKESLIYFILSGIKEAKNASSNIKFFTSAKNHYSLEHVLKITGLDPNQSLERIPTNQDGTIKTKNLEASIIKHLKSGGSIGGIILLGGETINHIIDPVKSIYDIRNNIVERYHLNYNPKIHLDSVNGFPWIFFKEYNWDKNILNIGANSLGKIYNNCKKLEEVKFADSCAIDFHKLGLAPYSSSFFLCKDSHMLDSKTNLRHGSYHPNQFTLANSRSADGIITSYSILKSLGKEGFQRYLAYLQEVGEEFRLQITNSQLITIINNDTNWNTSVFIPFSQDNTDEWESEITNQNNDFCFQFSEFLRVNPEYPQLGYIPEHKKNKNNESISAMMIYPMSPHYTKENIKTTIKSIEQAIIKFKSTYIFNKNNNNNLFIPK